jgi:hypothetical protein
VKKIKSSRDESQIKPRAMRTADAAKYLGISATYMRKLRTIAPDDPQPKGPAFRKLSYNIVLYEVAALDAWLESRPEQRHALRREDSPRRYARTAQV